MDGSASAGTIYTIGHGTRPFGDVEGDLAAHAVQMIVDVRSQPYSRRAPDFRRDPLHEHATAAGLGYRWMGDRLGGRPTDSELLDEEGRPDLTRMAGATTVHSGIDEVVGLARTSRLALLCAEGDPERCHRATLLAPLLQDRGFQVVHILPDGSAVPHQASLGW